MTSASRDVERGSDASDERDKVSTIVTTRSLRPAKRLRLDAAGAGWKLIRFLVSAILSLNLNRGHWSIQIKYGVTAIIGTVLLPCSAFCQTPAIHCSIADNRLGVELRGDNPSPDAWHCEIHCFFTASAEDDVCYDYAFLAPGPGSTHQHTCKAQNRITGIKELSCVCYNLTRSAPKSGCGEQAEMRRRFRR
jgi:hypothetical protein